MLPPQSVVGMCYWRRVRNTYRACGHVVTLPDEEIKCDLRNCKFSPRHAQNCLPPQCTKTCWQYHQYPQQYGTRGVQFQNLWMTIVQFSATNRQEMPKVQWVGLIIQALLRGITRCSHQTNATDIAF
ncbi:hypothetical protein OG21DRAFT_1436078 [Imleria badia]|nr:hypothetical protein OG21DRAFT_1436078 [Imleria badia]